MTSPTARRRRRAKDRLARGQGIFLFFFFPFFLLHLPLFPLHLFSRALRMLVEQREWNNSPGEIIAPDATVSEFAFERLVVSPAFAILSPRLTLF